MVRIYPSIFLIFSLLILCHASFSSVDVHLSSNSQLHFSSSATISTQKIENNVFYLVPNDGTTQFDVTGKLRPAQIIWIAIPPNKRIRLTNVTPRIDKNVKGELFREQLPMNDSLIEIKHPWVEIGMKRDFQGHSLAPIAVYFALEHEFSIAIASQIQIQISFEIDVLKKEFESDVCQTELEKFVINYKVANRWKSVRTNSVSSFLSTNQIPNGPIYRIKTNQEGITKLTGSNLLSVGINLSTINVRSIRMFSIGPDSIPSSVNAQEPNNWQEIPLLIEDGNDNRFDLEDRILFFGRSPNFWRRQANGDYTHWTSPYLNDVTFFLDLNRNGEDGLRMGSIDVSDNSPILPNAIGRFYYEPELSIFANSSFVGSGLRWVGPLFSGTMERSFLLQLVGALSTSNVSLITRFVEVSYGSQTNFINFIINQATFDTLPLTNTIRNTIPAQFIREGNNSLILRKTGNGSHYFDWIEATYTRDWTLRDGRLKAEVAVNSRFRVQLNHSSVPYVFETSNPSQIRWIKSLSFSDSGTITRNQQYFASDELGMFSIVSIQPVQWGTNQYLDLRDNSLQADYILIYDDAFELPAERLKNYRQNHNQVNVLNVRVSDIFDQFACGNLDPSAVRNFLRYAVRNWQRPAPKYVMFFGDGDFDYRGISYPNIPRPVISSQNGTTGTDDFFVRFGSDFNPPEMVTARLPVQNIHAANRWIDKLIDYETNPVVGAWKNRIILCADDENGEGGVFAWWETTHTLASDSLDYQVLPKFLDRVKIHLIEYQGSYDPVQVAFVKPAATTQLLTELERGALVVNWIGHGNPRVWAHEQLLRESRDLNGIHTGMKLPLWTAFTCDWAYWDDPAQQSLPEKLLEQPNNGAISVVAATRLTGPESNERLAQNFFSLIFDTTYSPKLSIAEALQLGKIRTTLNRTNSSYYHALGDPLLRLSYPDKFGWVETIQPDPIIPLTISNAAGKVGNQSNVHDPLGNGSATLTIRSSQQNKLYYWNQNRNYPYQYRIPGRLLYRGSGTISNGEFSVPILLPLDASYGDTNAVASLFSEGTWGRAAGFYNGIRTSLSSTVTNDSIGPVVQIFIDNRSFKEGEFVSRSPVLIADIYDSNGVNLTGEIGHKMLVQLDDREIDVTEFFAYAPNQTTYGTVEAPLGFINSGMHTLSLQVFDGANNPTIAKVSFIVGEQNNEVVIRNLLNYPNPIKNGTFFTFESSSSGAGKIDIYTVNGTKIQSIPTFDVKIGYNNTLTANWDGRDRNGNDVANGVYLWKLQVTADNGKKTESIGRSVVLK